ncbi:MAG: hypothetical protein HZB50_10380 [Chloroflexi bacterium]|nr:hypothetical protein [Chloroflexota bacterium]
MTEQTQTIICPACGGPSHPKAGQTHMPCTYCGANITIPISKRIMVIPTQEDIPNAKYFQQPEIDASDLLRKVQPVATHAFNLYAMWTWLRLFLPTCLVMLVIFFILCTLLGALPVFFRLFQ